MFGGLEKSLSDVRLYISRKSNLAHRHVPLLAIYTSSSRTDPSFMPLEHLGLIRASLHNGKPTASGGWRPVALRPQYLSWIAAIMFAMLITLEILRRYSDQYGGLYFFPDTDTVSDAQSFAYNYLPIIAALILVTLWTFIDYDVLRLEPYFQISRPEGAPASVLFINYNFGQSFLTPLTSAKRGHWVVLLVSLATLLIRVLLPALQSTLLELREITVVSNENIKTWPQLLDLHTQAVWIKAQKSNDTLALDSVLTARDNLHSSQSSSYAVAPVEISMEDRRESTVWTLNQTIYWSQMECRNIVAHDHLSVSINDTSSDPPILSWDVSGVQLQDIPGTNETCTLDFHYSNIFFPTTDYLQVRYWEPVWNNRSQPVYSRRKAFTTHGCDDPYDLYGVVLSVNATVAGANSINQLGSEFTSSAGIFGCKVEYRQAEAKVSMHANSSITNIYGYADTERELGTDQLNIDAFQDLLAQRAPYTGDMLFIELNETTGDTTVTELPVISQDLGDLEPLLVLDASTVMTTDEFESKVKRSVAETFVLTMSRLFNPDQNPTNVPAQRESTQVAIAVVSFASLFSEVILAIAICLTISLLYFYGTRPNILQSDPSSIGAMCSMLTDVFTPYNILANPQPEFHQFSTRQLRQVLRNCWLRWQQGPTGPRLEIITADGQSIYSKPCGLQANYSRFPGHSQRATTDTCRPNAAFLGNTHFHHRISSPRCRHRCDGSDGSHTCPRREFSTSLPVQFQFTAGHNLLSPICCRIFRGGSMQLDPSQHQHSGAVGPPSARHGGRSNVAVYELCVTKSLVDLKKSRPESAYPSKPRLTCLHRQHPADCCCRWSVHAETDGVLSAVNISLRQLQQLPFSTDRLRSGLHGVRSDPEQRH